MFHRIKKFLSQEKLGFTDLVILFTVLVIIPWLLFYIVI
jgi:hypothetical protein